MGGGLATTAQYNMNTTMPGAATGGDLGLIGNQFAEGGFGGDQEIRIRLK